MNFNWEEERSKSADSRWGIVLGNKEEFKTITRRKKNKWIANKKLKGNYKKIILEEMDIKLIMLLVELYNGSNLLVNCYVKYSIKTSI